MVHIEDKTQCCGCNACAQICPKNCIELQLDREGFAYPFVDQSRCISCGMCERVCPILHATPVDDTVWVDAYAAYVNRDDVRMKSSSGGIFSLLAEHVLNKHGVVIGAAFDNDFLVHHVCIESPEELDALRGSKYIQSRIEDTYIAAREYLKQERDILYTGTACQIAGLKSFLGKEYKNLLTADVLCHGVPSRKLWELYLREHQENSSGAVSGILFRDKRTGWKQYSVNIQYADGSDCCTPHDYDSFMRLYLANTCLRPSCHDCRFKGLNRCSDITLGDCWGIEKTIPQLDDDRGTSVVLVHTEKGKNMWNEIKMNCTYEAASVDMILPVTSDARRSVPAHANRDRFFRVLNRWGGGYTASTKSLLKLLEPPVYRKIIRKIKRSTQRLRR